MTINEIEPDTMDIRELAQRLGISTDNAYQLAKEDRLPVPAIRVGRKYRFSRIAYESLLHAQYLSDKP